jgi:hypothetical protein
MTPEQTAIVFDEYNAMNSTDDEAANMVDINEKRSIVSEKTETLDSDTGQRLREELKAKLQGK